MNAHSKSGRGVPETHNLRMLTLGINKLDTLHRAEPPCHPYVQLSMNTFLTICSAWPTLVLAIERQFLILWFLLRSISS
jgi:hypothetical protein